MFIATVNEEGLLDMLFWELKDRIKVAIIRAGKLLTSIIFAHTTKKRDKDFEHLNLINTLHVFDLSKINID